MCVVSVYVFVLNVFKRLLRDVIICHSFLGVHFIMLLSFLCRLSLPTSDLPNWSITAIKDICGLKTRQIFSKKPKICSMVKQLSDLLTKQLRNKK